MSLPLTYRYKMEQKYLYQGTGNFLLCLSSNLLYHFIPVCVTRILSCNQWRPQYPFLISLAAIQSGAYHTSTPLLLPFPTCSLVLQELIYCIRYILGVQYLNQGKIYIPVTAVSTRLTRFGIYMLDLQIQHYFGNFNEVSKIQHLKKTYLNP